MIRVNKDWVVDVDEYNYILKKDLHKKTIRKAKGKEPVEIDAYKVVGYFGTLESALNRLGDEIIKDCIGTGEMDFVQACNAIREAKAAWQTLADKVTKGIDNESQIQTDA